MKKSIIIIALLVQGIISSAQTINGIEISSIQSPYVEIIATQKLISTKVNIQIQFGQQTKVWKMKDKALLDADGKQVVFNSTIDALNFFDLLGYELYDRAAINNGQVSWYSIILKRK